VKRIMFVLVLITVLIVPPADTANYLFYEMAVPRTEAEARAIARRILSGGLVVIADGDQVIARCRVDDWEVYESWWNRLWRRSDSPCPAGTTEIPD